MKRITMAAALILMTFSANAQDGTQFSVGVAAAFSDYDGDSSFPVSDSGVGLQLYGGVKLNKWFGIEGGYYNSGTFDTDLDPSADDGSVEIAFSGFNLSAVGYIPIGDIELLGKVGALDYDIDLNTQVGQTWVNGSLGHATGLLLGAGAIINVSENIGIRTIFEWYDIDNADLWALSLGVDYRF